jgi:hypothetical protein
MRKCFYTFNSKIWSSAALLTVIIIAIVEITLSQSLPSRIFSHEVDRVLYDIDRTKYNADFVLLGDSIGKQIIDSALSDYKNGRTCASLGANQAIEMTGQYFLVERYLRNNSKPKAVIFVGCNQLGGNLEQVYTENFFQRCFLRFNEIAELTLHKGSQFSFIMMIYKIFPSYRYRLKIQEKLLGYSNANVHTGILNAKKSYGKPGNEARVVANIKYKLSDKYPSAISDIYFNKLVDMLKRKSIKFYYLNAPISESRYKQPNLKESRYRLNEFLNIKFILQKKV